VNPGAIRNEIEDTDREITDDSHLPCIFFLDSLKAHRQKTITKHVRNWLNSEWKRLKKAKSEAEEDPFNERTMEVYAPRGRLPCMILNSFSLHI